MSDIRSAVGTLDHGTPPLDLGALAAIERRVLWLAVRIVDHANRERPRDDELKVGGHQASSASMVTVMTALYLHSLQAEDRVSVKPHASPVLHAIEYLLGRLPREYLTTLRDFGGLQAYPSRTKDPFPVDYSTGSVGLGAVAPLFGALGDRFVESRFGRGTGGRFISLLGDAELDEGNIWEAIFEPLTRTLDNALWVVDLNRQSLDRVIPGIRVGELEEHFRLAGWHVIELKYGRKLRQAFGLAGGDLLRRRIDEMPNQEYQALFAAPDEGVRQALLADLPPPERGTLEALLGDFAGRLRELVSDLGGHDLQDVVAAFQEAREVAGRPTVIFAYTVKGNGLEIAGRPQNHSALLSAEQIDSLRAEVGLTPETEWERFEPDSPEDLLLRAAAARLARDKRSPRRPAVPLSLGRGLGGGRTSTQAAFGRILLELSRVEGLSKRLVTVSPDVATSTNLGGWINKTGVWAPVDEPVFDEMADSPLKWRVGPSGQHIEVGIAEMNLVLLLGQLGLTWDCQGEPLFPIGTLYDPFVMRALEGIVYSVYGGSRFIIVGTPSGISLSREGGAHQSLNTPGIGIETPGLTYVEPCYSQELEWLLLDGLARLHDEQGEALYLRLSTTPVDQQPFVEFVGRVGDEQARSDVVAGGFRLREPSFGGEDAVLIASCGAMLPEALGAAGQLEDEEGVAATVLALSSPDRLFHTWQRARTEPLRGAAAPMASHLDRLVRDGERGRPLVTVIDGSSHALAWLGSALGVPCVPLGIDRFGQVGSQPALYSEYEVDASAIVAAALVALKP